MCKQWQIIVIQLLRIPATVPLQLQSVLCLKSDHQKNMKYRAERPPFFFSLSVCLYFFVEFVCSRGHLGGHFGNFGCPDPHLDPKRTQGPENARFRRFLARTSSYLGGLLGHIFGTFFFGPPGQSKRGLREGVQN